MIPIRAQTRIWSKPEVSFTSGDAMLSELHSRDLQRAVAEIHVFGYKEFLPTAIEGLRILMALCPWFLPAKWNPPPLCPTYRHKFVGQEGG